MRAMMKRFQCRMLQACSATVYSLQGAGLVRISLLPDRSHLDMWPTIIMVMSSPSWQARPAVITIMRPSFSSPSHHHTHGSGLECGDTRRLKLINPRNNWGYWAEVNQLDWAEEQSVAPHHPADHWLHQAFTLLPRCRSPQCSPAGWLTQSTT